MKSSEIPSFCPSPRDRITNSTGACECKFACLSEESKATLDTMEEQLSSKTGDDIVLVAYQIPRR